MKQRDNVKFYTFHQFIHIPFLSGFHPLIYSESAVPTYVPIYFAFCTPHLFHTFFLYLLGSCTYCIPHVPTYVVVLWYIRFFLPMILLCTYFIYALYPLLAPCTLPIFSGIVADPFPFNIYPRVHTYFKFSDVLIVVPLSQKRCPSD
jgi:hypothetical protein